MVAVKANRREREEIRKVGVVVRVSTDMQAANPEGSLVTQLQRLRQQVVYKRDTIGSPGRKPPSTSSAASPARTRCAAPSSSGCSRTSARAA